LRKILYLAITVRFEKPSYLVNTKNSIVEPKLLLSGMASFDITVGVLEIDGTTTG